MSAQRSSGSRASMVTELTRFAVGIVWFAGAMVNALVTSRLTDPYSWLEESSLRPYRWFFGEIAGAHPAFWTTVVVIGELTLAALTLARRGWALVGLVGGTLFSLFLFVSGTSYTLMMAPFALLLGWLARYQYPETSFTWLRHRLATHVKHGSRA